MRVVHLARSDFGNGPARSVRLLHRELRRQGRESQLVLQESIAPGEGVHSIARIVTPGAGIFQALQAREFDENPAHLHVSGFSLGYPGRSFADHPTVQTADVLHLHGDGRFFSPADIAEWTGRGKPMVWSIADSWAFTGGCHSPVFCRKFQTDCRDCPQLHRDRAGLPAALLSDKAAWWRSANLHLVAPNEALANSARESAATAHLDVTVIPPGLDPGAAPRGSKEEARAALGIAADTLTLLIACELTGTTERTQQCVSELLGDFLEFNALKRLARQGKLTVLVLGMPVRLASDTIPLRHFDHADTPDKLAQILRAADLAVLPRVDETDAFFVLEATQCGTPVVAFDANGIAVQLHEIGAGQAVEAFEPRKMAEKISLLALDRAQLREWSERCTAWAAGQRLERMAQRYTELYRSLSLREGNPAERGTAPRREFLQACWNGMDHVLAEQPPPAAEQTALAQAAHLRMRNLVIRALEKLDLARQRFERFERATKSSRDADFQRAFTTVAKLCGTLRSRLERTAPKAPLRIPARESLRSGAAKRMPAAQRGLPHAVEELLTRRVVPIPKQTDGLGVLEQHPPRPMVHERFPNPRGATRELPSIAIVTPSYMQGHFIEKTITSVLDQNYPELRYAVQDAGSTDDTLAILQKHSARLAAWSSAPDTGQARAIFDGFQKISGDVMAWLNSDDTLMPGALRFVGEYFRTHPSVDALYGHRVIIDEQDQEIARWVLPPHDPELLRWTDYVPQETLFWRADLWKKVGGIDPKFRFAMDWDLLLRFSEAGANIVRVPYFLGCFRVHSLQKTSAAIDTVGAEEVAHLRLRTFGKLPEPEELTAVHRAAKHRSAVYAWLLDRGIRV